MNEILHPGMHAGSTPEKPAYIMADSGEIVTYGDLEDISNRCANLFRAHGLKAGDGIAMCLENHPRFLAICWGAHRAGLTYTCVATHLTGDEATYIVNDCGARIFIGSPARSAVAEAVRAGETMVEHWYSVDQATDGFSSLDTALDGQPAMPVPDESEGSDMLYSSGTTGRPKGVRTQLVHEPLGTPSPGLQLLSHLYQLSPAAVYLSPAPLYHAAPLRFTMSFLRYGATAVIMERFDPERALDLIEKYRCTHSQWVPTMFVRMLKLSDDVRERADLTSLKYAIHAAAPCPVPIKHRMIDWWGPILREYYAGTEGNGITVIDSEDWLDHPGSVGRPLLGSIHICNEDGDEVAIGETGTVYFADGNDFAYHNDPGKTAASRNRHGWTTLGDVGHVDEEGFLYLTDRKAHMIISGGVNVYPQEVENLLITHPKVLDAAVFGIPHGDLGEQVHAAIQLVPGNEESEVLEAELLGFCRDRLSHVKCPRSLDFHAELPRQANGKLYKRLLREEYRRTQTE
jgi:acyl-CoA synthetase (AMP-forming)/AMP-acid ligase II